MNRRRGSALIPSQQPPPRATSSAASTPNARCNMVSQESASASDKSGTVMAKLCTKDKGNIEKPLKKNKHLFNDEESPRSPQSPRSLQPPLPPPEIVNSIPYEKVDSMLRRTLNIFDNNDALLEKLEAFVSSNACASSSPNLQTNKIDDLTGLQTIMTRKDLGKNTRLSFLLMQTFKILLRKLGNRQAVNERIVRDLVHIMQNCCDEQRYEGGQKSKLATECANVCLNLCYEADNVELLVDSGGVEPLTIFLNTANNTKLQASAAGALQSICFQSYGRSAARDSNDCIQSLVRLMSSDDPVLQARTVGAIHNISSDTFSIHMIREAGAIEPLISHLQSPYRGVCGSAAGAIQNLSREVASRNIIRKSAKAVESLSDLLFGNDMEAVSCAVGALLNVIGPELGEESSKNSKRNSFKKLLSDSVAMGALWQTVWENMP